MAQGRRHRRGRTARHHGQRGRHRRLPRWPPRRPLTEADESACSPRPTSRRSGGRR
jgi:hypothetical protein